MLTMKTIMSQIQGEDWFVNIDLGCVFSHTGHSETQEVPSVCLWREGLPTQGPALQPGLGAENVHKMHGCCTGPFEAPGHSCAELSGRQAHSGSLQGASKSSQGYRSPPHPLGLRMNAKKSVLLPSQRTVFLGVRLDSIQMQARLAPARISNFTACLARFKLGHRVSVGNCHRLLGLMAVASPVLLHMRPFLWWMKELRLQPHCTSHSPYQGVAQLLSTPFTMAGPRFSPERGENGCDPLPPYDHIGRINDRLGRGLLRQTGERGMDRRVPLLAHNCLELRAVFLALMYFLPVLGGHHIIVRMDNMAVVSHMCTLDRLARRLLL